MSIHTYQAITIKFHGPTNTRGSRYIATCEAGRFTHHADHALNPSDNAAEAVRGLCAKLGWTNNMDRWFLGSTPKGWVAVHGLDCATIGN